MSTLSTLSFIEDYKPVSAYLSKSKDYEPATTYSDRPVYSPVYSDRHEEYEPTPTCQDKPKVGEGEGKKGSEEKGREKEERVMVVS
ncbi:10913_t:CDS:2 [Dentiscutata erythropus]|uniref:10913_t:CDS:1 n=1 Tax=Dentiscutata erythropus TaxID=1348616 RepID=A0A9N8ZVE1_9GLOM|nr:10913_t:CDS:2 [Dentiscutata erythropus]